MFFSCESTMILLFVSLVYFFVGCIMAGDITSTRCDTNLVEYSISRVSLQDSDGSQPDECNLTGCTIYADHSYNITIDACINLPSAVPITALLYDISGVLTLADVGLTTLVVDLGLDNGDLCNKVDTTTSPTSSCPVSLLSTSVTNPKCSSFLLHIPAPLVRRALSCLPLPHLSRPGVVTARLWKNTAGTNQQAVLCANVAIEYKI